jgi:Flp pilus assembly protein TadB
MNIKNKTSKLTTMAQALVTSLITLILTVIGGLAFFSVLVALLFLALVAEVIFKADRYARARRQGKNSVPDQDIDARHAIIDVEAHSVTKDE